jgi:hypothetical protein
MVTRSQQNSFAKNLRPNLNSGWKAILGTDTVSQCSRLSYAPWQHSVRGSKPNHRAHQREPWSMNGRLDGTLWWLIESVAHEFEMPPERAADEVAMLYGLAKEMMGRTTYIMSARAAWTS